MNEPKFKIKLTFITGLREVVLNEISQYTSLHIINEDMDSFYLDLYMSYRDQTLKRFLGTYCGTKF